MKHVMKIVKSLQYFGVLLEIALKQLRMKQKSKKVDLLVVSQSHYIQNLFENLSASKAVIWAGNRLNRPEQNS